MCVSYAWATIGATNTDIPNCSRLGSGRRPGPFRSESVSRLPFSTVCHISGRPRTSAMSTRIPFALFLNVGGKSENRAKLMVWPAAAAPSIETKKTLLVLGAELVGLNLRLTCVHFVVVPRRVVVAEPKTVPEVDRSPIVTGPEKDDDVGNR